MEIEMILNKYIRSFLEEKIDLFYNKIKPLVKKDIDSLDNL